MKLSQIVSSSQPFKKIETSTTTSFIFKMDGKKRTKTVKFNVGGTKYEVSRTLIEGYPDTMLERLVSDTWQTDPEKEIFIERDGLRFRYVLDYMRDKRAFPLTVSVASVLLELEYFGFIDVPPGSIDGSCAVVEAAKTISAMRRVHDTAISAFNTAFQELENKKCYEKIAYMYYHRQCAGHSINGQFSQTFKPGPFERDLFNAALMKYGIICVSAEPEWHGETCFTLTAMKKEG